MTFEKEVEKILVDYLKPKLSSDKAILVGMKHKILKAHKEELREIIGELKVMKKRNIVPDKIMKDTINKVLQIAIEIIKKRL